MDMTDAQVNALMDELQSAQKRAKDAEAKCEHLTEAIDWMVIGIDPLTSDDFIPSAKDSTVLKDNGPIAAKDAAFVAALYAVRHGTMLAFHTLRDDPPERLAETARKLAADELDIHDHELVQRSMMGMLKMALYIKSRGVDGPAGDAVAGFPL